MTVQGKALPDVKIRPCGVDELRKNGNTLFQLHREELEPGSPPLNIDWKQYYEAEERGILLCLGAWAHGSMDTKYGVVACRDLVGYCIMLLCGHPHFADFIICQHDALYLDPIYRVGNTGTRLIHEAERVARDKGACRIMWHAKNGTTLEPLLQCLGYEPEEIIYQRDL